MTIMHNEDSWAWDAVEDFNRHALECMAALAGSHPKLATIAFSCRPDCVAQIGAMARDDLLEIAARRYLLFDAYSRESKLCGTEFFPFFLDRFASWHTPATPLPVSSARAVQTSSDGLLQALHRHLLTLVMMLAARRPTLCAILLHIRGDQVDALLNIPYTCIERHVRTQALMYSPVTEIFAEENPRRELSDLLAVMSR